MLDKLSKMGYRKDSPYRNRKSITIKTPKGLIDMSQTNIPLYAEDDTGYSKILQPYSGMHQFPGKEVKEVPMGNIYQQGGMTQKQIYDFLFSDDEDKDDDEEDLPTAPSTEELQEQRPPEQEYARRISRSQKIYEALGYDPDSLPDYTGIGKQRQQSGQSLDVGDRAKYAHNYLMQKGLPSHVAAGIVGNFVQESGNFRQDVIEGRRKGDSGLATGIAQWHPDRWSGAEKWAKQNGRDIRTLDGQLDFALYEATQRGDIARTMQAQTAEEAANIFAKYYERPKIIDKNRAAYAKRLNPYKMGGIYNEIFN